MAPCARIHVYHKQITEMILVTGIHLASRHPGQLDMVKNENLSPSSYGSLSPLVLIKGKAVSSSENYSPN